MKLPVIDSPVFEVKLVSIDQPVKFRPFTVKEEKILLIAEEGKEDKDILSAIRQVINNCCMSDIDVGKLPLFDVEYFFLQLRSKSVGNIATLRYRDKADGIIRDFDVDIDSIVPKVDSKHSNVVKITDNITVEFRYPSLDLAAKVDRTSPTAEIEYLAHCIENIYEGEEVYDASNFAHEQKVEWINGLSTKMLDNILETFVNTMPTLSHTLEYVNSSGDARKIVLEGYRSFFPQG
jgi:hypothetical protein